MTEPVGCARPTGVVVGSQPEEAETESISPEKEKKKMAASVGKKAPDFTAPAYYQGEFTEVTLSDYLKKWVLLCFYPGDFTFVWATEVSAVADRYEELQNLGVEVISISVDSPFVHKVWNDQELSKMIGKDIPFPMASDGPGHVGSAFGVFDAEAGVELRGRFLIDPNGVIQAMEVMTPPVGRKIDEAIRQIKAFQHVQKHDGAEVCPAGWEPGKKVLKPGPGLVGNVWKEWNPKDDL